jgi:hypothetical protein
LLSFGRRTRKHKNAKYNLNKYFDSHTSPTQLALPQRFSLFFSFRSACISLSPEMTPCPINQIEGANEQRNEEIILVDHDALPSTSRSRMALKVH